MLRHRSRSILAAVAAGCFALSGLVGCSSPAASDPYEAITASATTAWDPLQINIGIQGNGGGSLVSIDPSDIGVLIDSAAGKGAVHVAIPASTLGMDASAIASLGAKGSSIDFDLVYDGNALFVRSPIVGQMLPLLLAGDLPKGDLSGWLRLGTVAELATLGGAFGGVAPAVPAPTATGTSLKDVLDAMGVTLTTVGSENHGGVATQHLRATVDASKLLANPAFGALNSMQQSQMRNALNSSSITGDVWVDPVKHHVVEIDLHVADKTQASQTATISLQFHDPDGTIATTTPTTHVDIPAKTLLTDLMKLVGPGLPTS